MKILVTHGAQKNVGDYFIHERGMQLLRRLRPEDVFASVPRWAPTTDFTGVEKLILCGGPGLGGDLSKTYPIAYAASQQGIPIAVLALGWSGHPRDCLENTSFSAGSVSLLHQFAAKDGSISVRDPLSGELASLLGISSTMTGCVSWYKEDRMGNSLPPAPEAAPRRIVYTPPASPKNAAESIQIMRMIKRRFPSAEVVVSFHRGFLPGKHTDLLRGGVLFSQAAAAKFLGFRVIDASYDLSRIDFYQAADLHIGYRVHAHLWFLSDHKPSLLICEDGRGLGQHEAMNPGYDPLISGTPRLCEDLEAALEGQLVNEWTSLARSVHVIERTYPVMERYIREL